MEVALIHRSNRNNCILCCIFFGVRTLKICHPFTTPYFQEQRLTKESLTSGNYRQTHTMIFPLVFVIIGYVYGSVQNIEFNIVRRISQSSSLISINGHNDTLGPTLRFSSGDDVNLLVNNYLKEPVSIHFHGLILSNTKNWGNLCDGVPGVTQKKIPSGFSYWYNFTIPNSTCGTFWYHSHSSIQYGEGLRGVVIVDCPEMSEYERKIIGDGKPEEIIEQIITLSDYYTTPYDLILDNLISPNGGPDPHVDGLLFNGKLSSGQIISSLGGKVLKIKLINIAVSSTQVFHIDNHEMIIIETDGILVKPWKTKTLSLAVGQRYTILVLLDKEKGNSKIIHGSSKMMGYFTQIHWLAYNESGPFETSNQNIDIKSLPDFKLDELYHELLPVNRQYLPDPTYKISLDYKFSREEDVKSNYGTGMYLVNNSTMPDYLGAEDEVLILGARGKHNPISLPFNETVEIAINSIDHMRHPWHLHGHWFQVVSIGTRNIGPLHWNKPDTDSMKKYKEDISYWNQSNVPMMRDSINIQGHSYAVIRFTTNNPGYWLLHCHVDWHMMKGLGVILSSGTENIQIKSLCDPFLSKTDNQSSKPSTVLESSVPSLHILPGDEDRQVNKFKVLLIYFFLMCLINSIIYFIIM